MTYVCNLCGGPAYPVSGEELYPYNAELVRRRFIKCAPCAAWTLADANGYPIGGLANVHLRAKRRRAHEALKPLWIRSVDRGIEKDAALRSAYQWLGEAMQLKSSPIINGFDESLCDRAIALCNAMVSTLREAA